MGLVGVATPACFFLISVAYKLAWTAISSLLSQFSRDYGPEVLLQLNIAYFLPSIPVLIVQTLTNDAMDARLGSAVRGAGLRFAAGLGGLVLLTKNFPTLATSHTSLLATTTAVGVSYGMAFGTSYQLASRFPASSTVMLTTGFVSSGPIVLALDLALKRGPFYDPSSFTHLFSWVSLITAGGLAAAALLLLMNARTINAAAAGKGMGGGGDRDRDLVGLPRASSGKGSVGSRGGRSLFGGGGDGGGGAGSGTSSNWAMGMGGGGSSGVRHRPDHDHHSQGQYGSSQQYDRAGGYGASNGQHAVMLDLMEGGGSSNDADGSSAVRAQQYSGKGVSGGGGWGAGAHHGDHHRGYGQGGYEGDDSSGKMSKKDLALWVLAIRISPAILAIFLSVGTSMLVFPFFTYMRSTGLMGVRLAQALFYIRLVGDVAGRLVPRRLQASRARSLLFWAAVKTAMVPLIFCAIFSPEATGGDLGMCAYVALFWVLSGYLNTCAYLVAPTLVAPAHKARASGLMTVAFQASCLIALLGAAAVQHAAFPSLAVHAGPAGLHDPGLHMAGATGRLHTATHDPRTELTPGGAAGGGGASNALGGPALQPLQQHAGAAGIAAAAAAARAQAAKGYTQATRLLNRGSPPVGAQRPDNAPASGTGTRAGAGAGAGTGPSTGTGVRGDGAESASSSISASATGASTGSSVGGDVGSTGIGSGLHLEQGVAPPGGGARTLAAAQKGIRATGGEEEYHRVVEAQAPGAVGGVQLAGAGGQAAVGGVNTAGGVVGGAAVGSQAAGGQEGGELLAAHWGADDASGVTAGGTEGVVGGAQGITGATVASVGGEVAGVAPGTGLHLENSVTAPDPTPSPSSQSPRATGGEEEHHRAPPSYAPGEVALAAVVQQQQQQGGQGVGQAQAQAVAQQGAGTGQVQAQAQPPRATGGEDEFHRAPPSYAPGQQVPAAAGGGQQQGGSGQAAAQSQAAGGVQGGRGGGVPQALAEDVGVGREVLPRPVQAVAPDGSATETVYV